MKQIDKLVVFGGDAAAQRANNFAAEHQGIVCPIENLNPKELSSLGLDIWGRKNGVQYTHAVKYSD